MPVISSNIGDRSDLAVLCNNMKIKRALEVGTDRGVFAAEFMDKWHGDMLWCLDPWEPYEEMPWDRMGDLLMATTLLAPHARRVRIVRGSSDQLSFIKNDNFPEHFGFIYIDAAHSAERVLADLRVWWPRVERGGIFAGDDYGYPLFPWIKDIVDRFADEVNAKGLYLTRDSNRGPSWYMFKDR